MGGCVILRWIDVVTQTLLFVREGIELIKDGTPSLTCSRQPHWQIGLGPNHSSQTQNEGRAAGITYQLLDISMDAHNAYMPALFEPKLDAAPNAHQPILSTDLVLATMI